MPAFDEDQIAVLRADFIRDEADADSETFISSYNMTFQKRLVSDATINRMKSRVESDMAGELAALVETTREKALMARNDEATADAIAADVRLTAVMKLVTAEVLELQERTADFMATVSDADARKQLLDVWREQKKQFRTFTAKRTSSAQFGRVRR